MAMSVDEFAHELFQEILLAADAHGQFVEDVFFEKFCEYLTEYGELDTADRALHSGQASRGVRVDGYGGDPIDTGGILSLVVADCQQARGITPLNRMEMESLVNRPVRFVLEALKADWRNQLEETSDGFGLAELIASRWNKVTKVRVILISNRELRLRVDGIDTGEIDGRPVTYSVWDITRLHRFAVIGKGKEDIEIDLKDDYGSSLPLLPAHLGTSDYEAYLAVVPGELLANIYDRWGARLLEQNVRVFLQARGNVNKGIRNTLQNDAPMFFAYNNGITATAEEIETQVKNGQLVLAAMKNFQIVNGGQTTASIHVAFRNKVDLSNVFVQMKLSIVDPARSSEVVPRISEYANSQNRVNAADFFANHPFHVRMEEFSRRIYAPSPDGTFRETKWFYERARGQYADARSLLTPAQRKGFDLEHPRSQLISKTDLAKFLNVWAPCPDKVSLGAQKNFALFAQDVGKAWDRSNSSFNEDYFREVVAKAIVFKSTEKIVSGQPWYQGGYRANIVAYAISRIAHEVMSMNRSVNFMEIWKRQAISETMEETLARVAKDANDVLTDPQSDISNVTEWAKRQACWARMKDKTIRLSKSFVAELMTQEETRDKKRGGKKDWETVSGIMAQTAVVNAGSEFWSSVQSWASRRRLLSGMEDGILRTAQQMPTRIPSEKQCKRLIELLARIKGEGFAQELGRELDRLVREQ